MPKIAKGCQLAPLDQTLRISAFRACGAQGCQLGHPTPPALAPWFLVQPVTLVMGKGSIPTYAPPYVPTGPVIGGSIIEASPHFDL